MIYALTQCPTPVFNTPDLISCYGGADGMSLPIDEQQLMRSVETVLFPKSRVELLEQCSASPIWLIRTEEYPYEGKLYLDERFVKRVPKAKSIRAIALPSKKTILGKLNALEGARYIWGGNFPEGISLLHQLYPSKKPLEKLDPLVSDTWTLKGFDCSGLLYYVTNGWTPRNTSSLVEFGDAVRIEGLTAEQIQGQLQPLDLIAWKGHVVICLDQCTSIESRAPIGVVKMDLLVRLNQIIQERKPVNAWKDEPCFVIRRVNF
jgi:hypothetical protein